MIIAEIATDWLELSSEIGFLLLGAAIGWVAEWIRNRSKIIHDVSERYILDRRATSDQDEPGNRLGSMQCAGVGLLKNDRQITEFCRIVVGRGCTHPFLGSDLDRYLKEHSLIPFLNEASRKGIALNDDMALYDFLIQSLEEAEDHSS